MEKIFDIVSSYIPEEQRADIKAKIDGTIGAVVKERDKIVKRELSEKYKVNFFEEDINKAFENDNFIPKTKLEEVLNEKEQLAKSLEELNTFKTEYEQLKGNYEKETKFFESSLKLVGVGFNPDRLHLVKNELAGDPEQDVKNIKEKYPELFYTKKEAKLFPEGDEKTPKTSGQAYLERAKKERLNLTK